MYTLNTTFHDGLRSKCDILIPCVYKGGYTPNCCVQSHVITDTWVGGRYEWLLDQKILNFLHYPVAAKLCESLLFVVVQVGFTQSAFPVSEADGSVSVCTAVSGAVLDRNITVLLSTQDNTATCKFVCFVFNLSYVSMNQLVLHVCMLSYFW